MLYATEHPRFVQVHAHDEYVLCSVDGRDGPIGPVSTIAVFTAALHIAYIVIDEHDYAQCTMHDHAAAQHTDADMTTTITPTSHPS